MPRKKAEKPEVVEEKSEETMDRTPDGREEAVLSDSDINHTEGTEGENSGEEISQTDMENSDNQGMASSGTKGQEADSEKESQSDTEEAQEMSEAGVGEEIPQTGSEDLEDKVYSPEDALDLHESSGNQSQSDTESAQTMNTADAMAKSVKNYELQNQSDTEGQNPKAQGPGEGKRRRRVGKSPSSIRLAPSKVLAIDGQLIAETEAEKARNDLLDLMESQKTGRILTGTIQGVERQESNQSRSLAVIYHGEFKIIIPAEEAVEAPDDFRGRLPEDVLHDMLNKRLGAEVDYIVKGIDPQSGIAAASRLDAMRARRKEYYLGTDRDGNYRIYSDLCAEARVVSVIRAGIFVDLFGLEVYIPLRELSYQRWMDAAMYFQSGQRILVKVLSVDRSDRSNIRVMASVKQAGENPYEKALRRYSVGNRYVGTVSMVDTNGVFVALDAGTRLGTVTTGADGRAVSDLDFPLMSEGYQKNIDSEDTETPSVEIPEETEKPTESTAASLPDVETLTKKFSFAGMFPIAAGKLALSEMTGVPEKTEKPEVTGDPKEDSEESDETETPDTDEASGSSAALNSGDYYLKELSVPGSYYLNETEYPVHLEYKDQETKVIAEDVEAVNTQTSTVISKTSIANSEELPGCELQITDATGSAIVSWTSGDKDSIKLNEKLEDMGYRNVTAILDEKGAVQVNDLIHDTTYTLTEIRPADGFITADSISFQLVQGENGQTQAVIINGENRTLRTDNVIHMVDDTTKVEISKTEIAGSEEIPGCELQITEKDTDTVIESWTSTKEKHIIEQKLAVGKSYILTEKRPADGYATADSIEFAIEDSGEVQSVQMKDDTTKIRLIKLASDTGQGLRGAKFEVFDSSDKKVMSFTSKEEGYDIIGKLKAGETYTFKEIEAPKGYQLAEPVQYTVKDTGEVQKVSVTDKKTPGPKVPQTGGTTPLVAVILLFLLGCGFLLYRSGVRFSVTSFFRRKMVRVK